MILWLATALARACSVPATAEDLSREVVGAERATRDLDREALVAADARVASRLACLEEPLDPNLVASIFRTRALTLFVVKDREEAVRWMIAARAADPGFVWPLSLVPSGHPLRREFETVSVAQTSLVAIPRPSDGWIEVDGRRTRGLPSNRPWILQWRRADGSVGATAIGTSPPASWPFPVDSAAPRTSLGLELSSAVVPTATQGQFRAGFGPVLFVNLVDGLSAEAVLNLRLRRVADEVDPGWFVVPSARLGVRRTFDRTTQGGFVGAYGAIAVSNDPPLQLGALLGGGFRSRKQLPVEWSARVGYLAGPLVEVSAGLGLPMPRRQEQTTP